MLCLIKKFAHQSDVQKLYFFIFPGVKILINIAFFLAPSPFFRGRWAYVLPKQNIRSEGV